MCVSVSIGHVSAGTHRSLKRKFGALQLEIQAAVSRPMFVPGTEFPSSGRGADALSHEAISPHLPSQWILSVYYVQSCSVSLV